MRTINLTIEKQTLTLDSLESLPVQGSDNSVKLAFAFDNSWESYPTRRAYFQYHFSNWKYVELSNNEVLVPREFLAKPGFKVMIRGYAQSGAIMATNIENVPVEFAPSLADSTAVVPVAIRSGDDAISVEQEGDVVTISLNDEFESNKFISDYTIRGTAQGEIIFLDGVLLGTTEKSFADFKSIYNQIVIPYEFTIGATTYHDTLVATETRYNAQNAYYIADLLPLGQNYTAIVTIYLDETSVKAVIACLPFTLNNSFDNAPTSGSTKLVNSGAVYSALESTKTLLRAYSDANLATAKSYADDLLVEGKQYTDNKYNSLVGIITHETEVMEARITSAITQMQNQVNASITGMETTIQGELTALDQRVDEAISTMNTTITTSLTNMETTIQQELANLDTRFSTLQTALEARITTLSNQIDSQFSTLQTQLEGRIDTLEGEVDTKLSEADEAIAILNGYNDRLTKVEGTYVTKLELYEALKRGEISSEVEKIYTSEINYITDNLMPSGKVTKILGKTEKSENLIVMNNVPSTTTNGVTYKVEDGAIPVNGTNTGNVTFSYVFAELTLQAGTYYFKGFIPSGSEGTFYIGGTNGFRDLGNGNSFTLNEPTTFRFAINVLPNTSVNFVIHPMLVKGSTAPTTWTQGYEGLKHTHITGLKSTKTNLLNIPNGTYDNTSQAQEYLLPNAVILEAGTYTFSLNCVSYYATDDRLQVQQFDLNGMLARDIAVLHPRTGTTTYSFTLSEKCKVKFRVVAFGLHSTIYNEIMLNFGNSALPFVPYEQDTLDIDFEGNGVGTAQDEINVEEKKHYQRLNTLLDLGTLDFNASTSADGVRIWQIWTDSVIANLNIKPALNNGVVANIICSKYTAIASNTQYNSALTNDMTISVSSNGYITLRDSSTDNMTASELKTYLSGIPFTYELNTPIVTDVEIPKDGWIDNLIQGGSLTQQVDTTDNTALIAKEVDIAVNVVTENQ